MSGKFFEEYEQKLLSCEPLPWQKLETIPHINGVYMIWTDWHQDGGEFVYIGESKNLYDRFYRHHNTGNNSSFRDRLQKDIQATDELPQDVVIDSYLGDCLIKYVELPYGRKELEEYLIKKYNPRYNRQGKLKCKSKV